MPTFKASQLPDRVRLYLIAAGTGKALPSMPVQLVVETDDPNGALAAQSVGLLASNHAGYVSFNLGPRKGRLPEALQSIHAIIPTDPATRVDLTSKLVQLASNQNLPGPAGRWRPEVIPIPVLGHHPPGHSIPPGLNSIEDPDVDDWVQSPGSFASDPAHVLGEGDCEMLLPSRATERIVRFHQLVRGRPGEKTATLRFAPRPGYDGVTATPDPGWPSQLSYCTGELRHYELVWRSLGHALGKVLYSLTLAPCEAVRIAVLEWARTEEASRTDATRLSEQLSHSLRRDRTVEEVVNAVLQERQNGESFMGGMAGVGGYGGGMGGGGGMGMPAGGGSSAPASGAPGGGGSGPAPSGGAGQSGGQQAGQNWGITGSHSLGYAMANSSGNREVDVETTQNIIDEVAQASHLVRDLRSTVIVQARQAEREIASTRIVRNHNHSHAMTVLYYEVVRHYLVQAAHRRTQPVIFVRYPVTPFDQSVATRRLLRAKTSVLRSALLEPRFAAGFDALYPVDDSDFIAHGGARIVSLAVNIQTGEDSTEHDRLKLLIVTSAGEPIIKDLNREYSTVPHYFNAGPGDGLFVDQLFNSGASNTFFFDMTRAERYIPADSTREPEPLVVSPLDLQKLGIVFNKHGEDDWSFDRLTVYAAIQYFDLLGEHREFVKILDTRDLGVAPFKIKAHGDWTWDINLGPAAERLRHARSRATSLIELIDHLDQNRLYYNAALWLNENPQDRAARFENYSFTGGTLLEAIDNRPIDVVGDYVVFPLGNTRADSPTAAPVERVVSLPTRGAFAETKLSHCNASEVIDDTRFWDWQISPCPDEPTEIQPVALGTTRPQIVATPGALPASGVEISDPQAAPEPFGMREVMELLQTPDVFRNMSGIEQLGPLLQKLVEVAGEVEKARIGATTELARGGASANSGGTLPNQQGPTPPRSVPAAAQPSPQNDARDDANVARAIDQIENPEMRQELTEEHARRRVRQATRRPATQTDDGRSEPASEGDPGQLPLTTAHFNFYQDPSGINLTGDFSVSLMSDIEALGSSGVPFLYPSAAHVQRGSSVRVFRVPSVHCNTQALVTCGALYIAEWRNTQLLTRLFTGEVGELTGVHRHDLGGGPLTATGSFTLDPSSPGSFLFRVTLPVVSVTMHVRSAAELLGNLERTVEGSGGIEIVKIVARRLLSAGGSVGGGAEAEFDVYVFQQGMVISH